MLAGGGRQTPARRLGEVLVVANMGPATRDDPNSHHRVRGSCSAPPQTFAAIEVLRLS
jgi:hypothetical protein